MEPNYNDIHAAIERYKESDTLAHYRTPGSKNGESKYSWYQPIGQKAKGIIDASGRYIYDNAYKAANWAGEQYQNAVNGTNQATQTVGNAVKTAAQTAGNTVTMTTQNLASKLKAAAAAAKTGTSNLVSSLKSKIAERMAAEKAQQEAVKTGVQNTVNNATNAVKDAANNVKTGVQNTVNNATNAVKDAANNVKTGVQNTVDKTIAKAKDAALDVSTAVSDATRGKENSSAPARSTEGLRGEKLGKAGERSGGLAGALKDATNSVKYAKMNVTQGIKNTAIDAADAVKKGVTDFGTKIKRALNPKWAEAEDRKNRSQQYHDAKLKSQSDAEHQAALDKQMEQHYQDVAKAQNLRNRDANLENEAAGKASDDAMSREFEEATAKNQANYERQQKAKANSEAAARQVENAQRKAQINAQMEAENKAFDEAEKQQTERNKEIEQLKSDWSRNDYSYDSYTDEEKKHIENDLGMKYDEKKGWISKGEVDSDHEDASADVDKSDDAPLHRYTETGAQNDANDQRNQNAHTQYHNIGVTTKATQTDSKTTSDNKSVGTSAIKSPTAAETGSYAKKTGSGNKTAQNSFANLLKSAANNDPLLKSMPSTTTHTNKTTGTQSTTSAKLDSDYQAWLKKQNKNK